MGAGLNTDWQVALVDPTTGNRLVNSTGLQVQGPAATGAAAAGNPLLSGAKDTSGNVQPLSSDTSGRLAVVFDDGGANKTAPVAKAIDDLTSNGAKSLWTFAALRLFDNASGLLVTVRNASSAGGASGSAIPPVANMGYDGAAFQWLRMNTEAALLASAARTTTQTSADIITYNLGAIQIILDMTVVGTGSVTLSIDGKDPASGKYYNLLTGAAVTTNSTNVYTVDPSVPAVANVTAQKRLPRTIRIVVTANNANSATYSVGYVLQPVA